MGLSASEANARFAESVAQDFPGLEGRQDPEVLVCADKGGDFSHADKAVTLAKRFGVKLMPWEQRLIELALEVNDEGRWVHSDVVVVCPRQNGKSLILEVVILYRLFVLHQQIVFTAHQWKTAKSIRNRIWRRVKSKGWAQRRLVRNTASAGEAEMETSDGGKIQFTTRSNDAGRGFDQIDVLMLDEAYNLDSGELDAMAPTQLAAEDPQTFYTSSAVNADIQVKGEELSKVRWKALTEKPKDMLFAEFCAPRGLNVDSPETWKLANPSYGIISNEKKIRSLQTKLTETGFEVELLGWGNWFEFGDNKDEDETLLDVEAWKTKQVNSPVITGDCCLGVDASPDGEHVGLVAAVQCGKEIYLSLSPNEGFDRDEIVGSISRTVAAYDPLAVIVDPSGPVSTLVEPLEAAGVAPEKLNGGQVSNAYELLMRLWVEGKIIHDGNPRWVAGWMVAQERSRGGRYRSFERYASNVSVLVAASFAVWGLQEFSIPAEAPVMRKTRFVGKPKVIPTSINVHEMAF